MDLSISADALNAEKADAIQSLEKAVANSLYKLGEDIDAFDEAAFLADVDGYKATKEQSLDGTIDYLKVCLDLTGINLRIMSQTTVTIWDGNTLKIFH